MARKTSAEYQFDHRQRKLDRNECNRCDQKRERGKTLCAGCAEANRALMARVRERRKALKAKAKSAKAARAG
jgi:hypothetical protein